MTREITGWHVLGVFVLAFSIIIAVNVTLAVQAVRTFPGLEVKNSYVASQTFDADRDAQVGLNWDVSATLQGSELALFVAQDGQPIAPRVEDATFGRATSVARDQTPHFRFEDGALRAPVVGGDGNWNLRVKLRAEDGTLFQQRVIVKVLP
ncbi:FixH family protein [Loktanella sp. R86503]|uniref:FixH family protein n=1 Tax=Loktanella sp. R86503 TaxID=3093847 RepID=UPI0036DBF460